MTEPKKIFSRRAADLDRTELVDVANKQIRNRTIGYVECNVTTAICRLPYRDRKKHDVSTLTHDDDKLAMRLLKLFDKYAKGTHDHWCRHVAENCRRAYFTFTNRGGTAEAKAYAVDYCTRYILSDQSRTKLHYYANRVVWLLRDVSERLTLSILMARALSTQEARKFVYEYARESIDEYIEDRINHIAAAARTNPSHAKKKNPRS